MIAVPVTPMTRRPSSATGSPAVTPDADAADELQQQEAVTAQREAFDLQTAEQAELEREADTLRDMMLQQLKDDDDTLKKYIAMI